MYHRSNGLRTAWKRVIAISGLTVAISMLMLAGVGLLDILLPGYLEDEMLAGTLGAGRDACPHPGRDVAFDAILPLCLFGHVRRPETVRHIGGLRLTPLEQFDYRETVTPPGQIVFTNKTRGLQPSTFVDRSHVWQALHFDHDLTFEIGRSGDHSHEGDNKPSRASTTASSAPKKSRSTSRRK